MNKIRILISLLAILSLTACGRPGGREGAETQSGPVAVAKFQQMRLPIQLEALEQYATNGKWFYITRSTPGAAYQILRGEIGSAYEGAVYVTNETAFCLALAADRESNCFILWKEKSGVYLEKYDESGKLLWHTDQDMSLWEGIGRNSVSDMSIAGSAVTTDGRLALYTQGTDSLVILFDKNGNLLQMTAPGLERLDGIAAGRDDRIYGYCVTGEDDPLLVDVENPENLYVLPFRPLKVFGGQEEGVYLTTSEGLWIYDPETESCSFKWEWTDEYMNVDGQQLQEVICGKEQWYLLCHTSDSRQLSGTTKVTVANVREENRREYGEKEVITLGYVDIGVSQDMKALVNLYNRQSKTYRVELISYGDGQEDAVQSLNAFASVLLREDGPDLMEVGDVYVGILNEKGVFQDLSDYYAGSRKVTAASILDPVWNNMQYRGENVLVIPSFSLMAQACEEPVAAEDWTPEKLIQLAREQEALWYYGTPSSMLLTDSLGRFGEYDRYIDYEEKSGHFDCPEFRQILENCAQAGGKTEYRESITVRSDQAPAFLFDYYISDMTEYLWHSKNLKITGCSWVGYPSQDGAVYLMSPTSMFAMNKKSSNQEGCWDFLEYILSEECQDQIDWAFPVRKDSFERYLQSTYTSREDAETMRKEFAMTLDSFAPTEADFENIWYMVNHSTVRKATGQIADILYEEAGMYFAGDATLDETVRKIDNRVTLYLNE